ncbi:MAG: N-acetyltransferase [Epsilonproteobacteria bacterium]|nr:N-acetyltransferase [Campylobacterota bacterium]
MQILKPTLKDINAIKQVLNPYIEEGIILNRNDDEIASNIRSYQVIVKDNKIIGVGALHIYSNVLAEIRSLAISKNERSKGYGSALVKSLLKEAKSLFVKEVLVLTYEKGFFEKAGFVEIPKEAIPDKKIWADCIKCKFFPDCKEIALITYLK